MKTIELKKRSRREKIEYLEKLAMDLADGKKKICKPGVDPNSAMSLGIMETLTILEE